MIDLTLVGPIKLPAGNPTEQRILDYLNENASEVLAAKINAGKKTLAGAVKYATDEARKMANGSGCVCVDDATVFGWIVHFFEEDEIEEPKAEKPKPAVRTPSGVKKAKGQKTEASGQKTAAPRRRKTEDGEKKPVEPKAEKPKGPIFLELFTNEEMGVKL